MDDAISPTLVDKFARNRLPLNPLVSSLFARQSQTVHFEENALLNPPECIMQFVSDPSLSSSRTLINFRAVGAEYVNV
jgi:hypothetical protein